MNLLYTLLNAASTAAEQPRARGFYWWEILIIIAFLALLVGGIVIKYKSSYISSRDSKYKERDIN